MHRLYIALLSCLAALTIMAAPALAALEQGHHIAQVKFAGAEIHLEDGSVWKVPSRSDWDTTYNWLPGQPMAVRDGKSLVNINTGEEIDVKRIKAPSAPKAAEQDKAAAQAQALARTGGPAAAPRTAPPAPAVAPAAIGGLEKRVDALEDKLQVLDWRLRRIEDLLKTRPQP